MITRCKFVCSSVKEIHHGGNLPRSFEYEFHAVYSNSEENKKFWEATPTGNLKFSCTKGPQRFESGKEYYLDIQLADITIEV